MSRRQIDITPDLMLRAYRAGLFPMAESRGTARLYWLDPERRGVIPIEGFHLPRRLRRTVLSGPYSVTADAAFEAVIAGCAAPAPGREDTWINEEIEELFVTLHRRGHAHSVETWLGDELVGGLYGVSLGAAFFGESMFSRERDASKVCLVKLVERLRERKFALLDTQFTTEHLKRFGAVDVPRRKYEQLLEHALEGSARFYP
jgi:leucyl/phenylalanyl-tRNA---protein transferase